MPKVLGEASAVIDELVAQSGAQMPIQGCRHESCYQTKKKGGKNRRRRRETLTPHKVKQNIIATGLKCIEVAHWWKEGIE